MKIAKSTTDPRATRLVRAFLVRKLDSAVGFIILACFLTAASSSRAQQPAFLTTPPAISPTATSTQAQGALNPSPDLNQAAMSQIINQLNQRQVQLGAAAAQTSPQSFLFAPRIMTLRRAK